MESVLRAVSVRLSSFFSLSDNASPETLRVLGRTERRDWSHAAQYQDLELRPEIGTEEVRSALGPFFAGSEFRLGDPTATPFRPRWRPLPLPLSLEFVRPRLPREF